MTVIERIFQEMSKKGIKQKELAERLGIKQGIIANWKIRGTTPPLEYALDICSFLDITIQYLVTGQTPEEEYYTDDERKLITVYRRTNETGKLRIVEYAQEMNQLHPEQEDDLQDLSASKIS